MINKKTPIILLVGGKGSRYLDDGDKPKQLAIIKNKPILIHMINSYFTFGFNLIILPLGFKKKIFEKFFNSKENKKKFKFNLIDAKLKKFKFDRINIFLFDAKKNISKLERIKKSLKYLRDFENIGVNYGDAISNINIKLVYKKFLKKNYDAIMSVTKIKSPYGHVILKKNIVKSFIEKPYFSLPTNIGYYFIKKSIIQKYNKKNKELETDFFKDLAKKKKLGFYFHKGYFHTVNNKQDLINLK